MEQRLREVLKKSRIPRRLTAALAAHPDLGWVTINALGELVLFKERPAVDHYHWTAPRSVSCSLGWLRSLCTAYGQRGRYGHSRMDQDYRGWCWTVAEFRAALQQPSGTPRTRRARLKKALDPVIRETGHLQDFWL